VDQPAEQLAAADTIKVDHVAPRAFAAGRRLAERRPLPEAAVRPVLVVMRRVRCKGVLEVAAADDQQPVEAFPADASDPALGVRSCLRRPHRRSDDTDAFGAEDLVELARELALAITNQESRRVPRIRP